MLVMIMLMMLLMIMIMMTLMMTVVMRDCGTYTLTIGHSTLEKCHLEHKLKLSQRLSNRQNCPEKETYFEHTYMQQHIYS